MHQTLTRPPHPPVDAPIRLPIDMPDHFDADETDGDGVIAIIALAFAAAFVIGVIAIFWWPA